jgi:hypothetical protein
MDGGNDVYNYQHDFMSDYCAIIEKFIKFCNPKRGVIAGKWAWESPLKTVVVNSVPEILRIPHPHKMLMRHLNVKVSLRSLGFLRSLAIPIHSLLLFLPFFLSVHSFLSYLILTHSTFVPSSPFTQGEGETRS